MRVDRRSQEKIKISNGEVISTRRFLIDYDATFTPTILFLDGEKHQLVEKIVGLTTADFYGFYLEKAIDEAIVKLKARVS